MKILHSHSQLCVNSPHVELVFRSRSQRLNVRRMSAKESRLLRETFIIDDCSHRIFHMYARVKDNVWRQRIQEIISVLLIAESSLCLDCNNFSVCFVHFCQFALFIVNTCAQHTKFHHLCLLWFCFIFRFSVDFLFGLSWLQFDACNRISDNENLPLASWNVFSRVPFRKQKNGFCYHLKQYCNCFCEQPKKQKLEKTEWKCCWQCRRWQPQWWLHYALCADENGIRIHHIHRMLFLLASVFVLMLCLCLCHCLFEQNACKCA